MKKIINDIGGEFRVALYGIKQLLNTSKNGVYATYDYYLKRTIKIESTTVAELRNEQTRILNRINKWVLISIYSTNQFKLA
ncbi:hypothetical protein [Patiriisocius sp. Uisw_017]|jgi:hypothetical protein|uniref:hypothetical protein n=1 Tax=Patiriisocius sp. Uisw_017 TaxID=3230968 RepID=UPI0039EBFB2D